MEKQESWPLQDFSLTAQGRAVARSTRHHEAGEGGEVVDLAELTGGKEAAIIGRGEAMKPDVAYWEANPANDHRRRHFRHRRSDTLVVLIRLGPMPRSAQASTSRITVSILKSSRWPSAFFVMKSRSNRMPPVKRLVR